jgi:hypothetical protein
LHRESAQIFSLRLKRNFADEKQPGKRYYRAINEW